MQSDFFSLIGQKDDNAVVIDFLADLGSEPEISVHDDKDEDGDCHFVYPNLGIEILFDAVMTVNTIYLYSGKEEQECKRFVGKLPKDLSFEMGRDQVRAKLGIPVKYNSKVLVVVGMEFNPFDKFSIGDRWLRVEYSVGLDQTLMVSVSRE